MARHHRLLVARAAAGRPGRRARGHLLARLRAARRAAGHAAVRAQRPCPPRCSPTSRTRPRGRRSRGAPAGFDRVIARALAKDARGPLPVGGRPRPRRAGGRARRAGDRVRAQRRRRPRRARCRRNGHASPTAPTALKPTADTRRADAGAGGGEPRSLPPRRRRAARWPALSSRIAAAGDRRGAGRPPRRPATAPARRRGRRCPTTRCATSPRTSPRPTRPRTARRSGGADPRRRSACCRAGSRAAARASCRIPSRQFRAQDTQHYELDDLAVQGGRAGRASGSYRVERQDGDPIEGRIVLGVVRDRGEPRIGLIAVTPQR